MQNYQPQKKPKLFKAVAASTLVLISAIVCLFQNQRFLNHYEASLNVDDIDEHTHTHTHTHTQMTKWDEYTNTSWKDMHENVSIASTLESTVATTKKSDIGTRLFIHVGPVKTGSSSVQCNLQVNPFLKDSSYDFMGRMERPNICPQTNHRKTKQKFWDMQEFVFRYVLRGWLKQDQFQGYVRKFKAYLQSNADNAINTIISAEEFCGLLQLDPPQLGQ